jgi:cytochrome c
MKKIASILLLVFLFSCKKGIESKKESLYPEAASSAERIQINLGETIFNGKGNCYACHKPDQKIIGPSLQEIVKIYKEKKGNMYDFLKNDAEPIVDPTQYELMKTNLVITKAMSDEELNALVAYIYIHNE